MLGGKYANDLVSPPPPRFTMQSRELACCASWSTAGQKGLGSGALQGNHAEDTVNLPWCKGKQSPCWQSMTISVVKCVCQACHKLSLKWVSRLRSVGSQIRSMHVS